MSTYFSIYAKPKNLPEAKSLCLFFLYTSAARNLDGDMHFVFDEQISVDCKFINEIIAVYQDKIDVNKKYICSQKKEQELLVNALLPKTTTEEIYQHVREDVMYIGQCIDEAQEENESYQLLIKSLRDLHDIINDEFNRHYEFYYVYA